MTREEAIERFSGIINAMSISVAQAKFYPTKAELDELCDMAIEALKNEPILCENCRHRNTWDNPRFDPQYYRCGKGVKFRDYGYVREDDYCPFGERREG